jgi:hypothetical protein
MRLQILQRHFGRRRVRRPRHGGVAKGLARRVYRLVDMIPHLGGRESHNFLVAELPPRADDLVVELFPTAHRLARAGQ